MKEFLLCLMILVAAALLGTLFFLVLLYAIAFDAVRTVIGRFFRPHLSALL